MIPFAAEVVVDRPVDEVARFLADVRRHVEWTDMSASRKLTDGPLRAGTQVYAEVAMGPPVKLGWTYEITEWDPARVMSYRTVSRSAIGMDGSYRMQPESSTSTRVASSGEIRTRGLLRLLEPIMRAELARKENAELERLKELVEAAPLPGDGLQGPASA
jgi:uncharacterized membrane protein